ncbi:thiol peroxidase [Oscillatoria sp. FACHB-1407]|uniref:thiol peroxidase n=1 Tax=Oscillatoria sp. FACHB-1407 TaxID=2692847 RepID=UPI001689EA3A|nr:thiol peroxidase [Oscillatoria sp. FACHB-1407]MBD2462048.1 thiol peroxidase [Oscillatoria sp. FACHB-1407]
MVMITVNGQPMRLVGRKVSVGDRAGDVRVTGLDLSPVLPLDQSQGKIRLLITVPSLDIAPCSLVVREFSDRLHQFGNSVAAYLISADLPFAQQRWKQAIGVDNITLLSDYRDMDFARDWGVLVQDLGLSAQAAFVVDATGIVIYREIVTEWLAEPDYDGAIAALQTAL